MLAKEARQKMRLSKQAFTNLLVTVDEQVTHTARSWN
jgi:hypothetical protein